MSQPSPAHPVAAEVRAGQTSTEFRDELLAAGILVGSGVPGLYHRSFAFERIVRALEFYLCDAGFDPSATQLHFAPVMPRAILERSGYLSSFPNLIGAVSTFQGEDADHRRLVQLADEGEDWTTQLAPAEVALCSAGCHQVYPLAAAAAAPEAGLRYEIQGSCFRHEPSADPGRMQSFRMHEFVYIGSPAGALAHRDGWLDRALTLLSDLELEVDAAPANDPFFGRAGRLLSAGQRSKELKFELMAPISCQTPGAIASANYHEDHFGAEFGLRAADGEVAHSACVGFGLERVTLALLRQHGLDPARWPAAVRELLTPRLLDPPFGTSQAGAFADAPQPGSAPSAPPGPATGTA